MRLGTTFWCDVTFESIQRKCEQLPALLEKKTKTLKLIQKSFPSGFANDSPLPFSVEELTTDSKSHILITKCRVEPRKKKTGNDQSSTQVRLNFKEVNPSVRTSVINYQTQVPIVYSDLAGNTSTSISITGGDSDAKMAKAKSGYHQSVNFYKKFIGRKFPLKLRQIKRLWSGWILSQCEVLQRTTRYCQCSLDNELFTLLFNL